LIDRIDGNLGSALGYKITGKKMTKTPAVIIFVPSKVDRACFPPIKRFPKFSRGLMDLGASRISSWEKKALDERNLRPSTLLMRP